MRCECKMDNCKTTHVEAYKDLKKTVYIQDSEFLNSDMCLPSTWC